MAGRPERRGNVMARPPVRAGAAAGPRCRWPPRRAAGPARRRMRCNSANCSPTGSVTHMTKSGPWPLAAVTHAPSAAASRAATAHTFATGTRPPRRPPARPPAPTAHPPWYHPPQHPCPPHQPQKRPLLCPPPGCLPRPADHRDTIRVCALIRHAGHEAAFLLEQPGMGPARQPTSGPRRNPLPPVSRAPPSARTAIGHSDGRRPARTAGQRCQRCAACRQLLNP